MKNELGFLLSAMIILVVVGVTGRAQPIPVNLPDGSRMLTAINDRMYFVGPNGSLYSSNGKDDGTLLLRSGSNPGYSQLWEFNGRALWLEGGSLWGSNGTPSG